MILEVLYYQYHRRILFDKKALPEEKDFPKKATHLAVTAVETALVCCDGEGIRKFHFCSHHLCTKPCYETTKYLASLPAATFTQVYEQGRGKGTMTAEEKRSVKQEMAEEMEQLDGYTSGGFLVGAP